MSRPNRRPRDLQQIAAAVVEAASVAQVIDPMAEQAATNTYQAPAGTLPGVRVSAEQVDVVGTNERRLIVRPTAEGVWIGGCHVGAGDLPVLISVLTGLRDGLATVAACYCGTGLAHLPGAGTYCKVTGQAS
jgi:hypothetical protein